ncbi:UNVERIFIED_CONTAM: hypothetical protein Slati_0856000 [Sesamum latifolium]|uniref:Uncharacterized protein n=1 Tax=Sesamum latifolium TaxID=2727402 RepID=A0AAW2XNK8_9LAMI
MIENVPEYMENGRIWPQKFATAGQAQLSTSWSSERASRAYAARGVAPPVRKVTPPGRLDVPPVAPR